jgi:hypothetical protein
MIGRAAKPSGGSEPRVSRPFIFQPLPAGENGRFPCPADNGVVMTLVHRHGPAPRSPAPLRPKSLHQFLKEEAWPSKRQHWPS